jgi:hypothetical protein
MSCDEVERPKWALGWAELALAPDLLILSAKRKVINPAEPLTRPRLTYSTLLFVILTLLFLSLNLAETGRAVSSPNYPTRSILPRFRRLYLFPLLICQLRRHRSLATHHPFEQVGKGEVTYSKEILRPSTHKALMHGKFYTRQVFFY